VRKRRRTWLVPKHVASFNNIARSSKVGLTADSWKRAMFILAEEWTVQRSL